MDIYLSGEREGEGRKEEREKAVPRANYDKLIPGRHKNKMWI